MWNDRPGDRRRFLLDAASGLASVAVPWMLTQSSRGSESPNVDRRPQHPPRVERVIQVFACGGVSHLDTFDYKPELERRDGREMTGVGADEKPFFGQIGRVRRSPFKFHQRGESGQWVSDLLPHLATCSDDITFLRGMVAKSSNHTPATFQMNSGFTMNGFPCLGAWLSYGLGTENENLPTFVVLPDPRGVPAGGSINWTSGFLPASHQGVAFRTSGEPIANLFPPERTSREGRGAAVAALQAMNREYAESHPGDSALEARVRAYELAGRMQTSIPEATELLGESAATRALYGLDSPITEAFGRNCLRARRLVERGVRFVQLYHGGAFGSPRINWDAHEDIVENHQNQAGILDRPLAGLLKELKARGLLDSTLVLFTTEFGRTPYTQGENGKGRDHHPYAFTCWMAGGGLKPGFSLGTTDDLGYKVVEDRTTVYDLHATVLHLLGIDHTRLTFYHNGIRRRLTDVHGEVIEKVLA